MPTTVEPASSPATGPASAPVIELKADDHQEWLREEDGPEKGCRQYWYIQECPADGCTKTHWPWKFGCWSYNGEEACRMRLAKHLMTHPNHKENYWTEAAQKKGPKILWWFRILHPKPGDEDLHGRWVKWLQETGAWPTNFEDGTWADLFPSEKWKPRANEGLYGPERTPMGTGWSQAASSSGTGWNQAASSSGPGWGQATSSSGSEAHYSGPDWVPAPGFGTHRKRKFSQ